MATWPATLPAPQKQLSFSPGSNLVRRKLQSGRVEVRRFGSGAPGRIEAVFRLKADQLGAFEYFYERNLCLGVNWFTASWLNTGDKARFLGHPRTLGRMGEYFDIAATLLLVDELDYTPEDVLWPTGGTGGGAEEPVVKGTVKVFGKGFVYDWGIYPPPGDLVAIKISIVRGQGDNTTKGRSIGIALKPDGTIQPWGESNLVNSTIPGYETLGSVIDIEGDEKGFYFITGAGQIGHIGSPSSGTGYPKTAGFCKFIRSPYKMKGAIDSAGILSWWYSPALGYHLRDFPSGVIIPNPWDTGVFSGFQSGGGSVLIDSNGRPLLFGRNRSAWQSDLPVSGCVCGTALGVFGDFVAPSNCPMSIYKTDGTWYLTHPENNAVKGIPPGLVPKTMHASSFYNTGCESSSFPCLAIHSDDTLVGWGFPAGSGFPSPAPKVHQICMMSGNGGTNDGTTQGLFCAYIEKES